MAAILFVAAAWPAWPLFVTSNPTVLADPGEYLLRHYGLLASVLLGVVLILTPLRVAFPRADWARRLQRHRRFIGVAAFAFAWVHFCMYILYSGGFGELASDWRKPFIAAGLSALGILTALGLTSMDRAIRRMGARRWKLLHRFVYLAAGLVVYHQISADKVFPVRVLWIFGPVAALQIVRVVKNRKPRRIMTASTSGT